MGNGLQTPYVLGLDVGTNSVGWAMVAVKGGKPVGILRTGARAFELAVEGDIESGREESHAVQRRLARQQRRQTERRARRHRKVFLLLQRAGLLPRFGDETADRPVPDRIHVLLETLDADLVSKHEKGQRDPHVRQVMPYLLRARALDEPLEPHELGRAFYHLAQRRGFLSNRKTAPKDEKEEKGMKKEIADLETDMVAANARTLGEYLSQQDPEERRIRQRHTSRKMYEDEFRAVWEAQTLHHPDVLTDEFRKRLHKAIFHQRPLKSVKKFIGFCEFEPKRRRAPWALLDAQRFRYLQRVNDLLVVSKETGEERALTEEERLTLVEALEARSEMRFTAMRRLLKLKKHEFNLERGGESKLPGNKTAAALAAIFGDTWAEMTDDEQIAVVEDCLSIQKATTLKTRGMNRWRLDEEAAARLSRLSLPTGHCRLSRQALARIVPLLQQGIPYATACKELYGNRTTPAIDRLPPVKEAIPGLTNPTVIRSLTELRKVVNSVVREYGKPEAVRIELVRDLKRSAKRRQDASKRNRQNERDREKAKRKIVAEAGVQDADIRRSHIEKVLLADECDWHCPYTGLSFGIDDLFGDHPTVDVEHIIPFRRSLDNTFLNKTLCLVEENRRKRDRTPFEAYGSTPDRWEAILERVRRFQGTAAKTKLRRFLMEGSALEEFLGGFEERRLRDTAYASKAAGQYLALLYGGLWDEGGTRRVQAGNGQATAYIRGELGMNAILGDGPGKSRDDHRHHAVDAVCVALTTPGMMKALSDAAGRAAREGRRRFAPLDPPWDGFLDHVRQSIDAINVSHRVSRRVTGALHKDTIYGPPQQHVGRDGKPRTVHHIRRPLEKLSTREVDAIVDPVVREAVREKLTELGGGDPRKLFASSESHPLLRTKDGRRVPVHRARVRTTDQPFRVGTAERGRYVLTSSNHHAEILEIAGNDGGLVWDRELVSGFDALRRWRTGQPVVRRDHGPDKRFVFSLAPGEIIELDAPDGERAFYRIRSISKDPRIEYVHINDARKIADIKKDGQWFRKNPEQLRQLNCLKVVVTPLGNVRWAND